MFGEFSYSVKKELKEYLSGTGIKKILCTYDKLGRLKDYLNPSDFRLLVDEYHILLKAYSYRKEAINGVLESFRNYKSFCFLSATPISADFKPEPLEDVEEVEAVWKETDSLTVKLERTNKPYLKAANIIEAYKKDGFVSVGDKKSYEAFFFINSVTDIADILKHCNLTEEEVRVICADTPANREKLKGFTISNSKAPNKKFNFITSKSFEGADFESESGLCFVVSNSRNKNTLLDVSTDIYQIAGRIRTVTNPFRHKLIHIFNTTGKRNLDIEASYEDVVEKVKKNVEIADKMVEIANLNPEADVSKFFNAEYISKDSTGRFYIDNLLIKLELYTFKIEQSIYKNGISIMKHYNQKGIATTNPEYERLDGTLNIGKKVSFKEAFLQYAELINNPLASYQIETLKQIQPLIAEAYSKLGVDRVKTLRYVKKNVEAALISLEEDKSKETRIAKILNTRITIGFNSSADIKEALSEAYSLTGVKKPVKATDIINYFDCKQTTQRIEGKVTKGFQIYNVKYYFK